jgi:hypothetical protein
MTVAIVATANNRGSGIEQRRASLFPAAVRVRAVLGAPQRKRRPGHDSGTRDGAVSG